MKIIISPAKKMNKIDYYMGDLTKPEFLCKANELKTYIKSLTYEEAKEVWKSNDDIARLNYNRFKNMNLEESYTPALFSYEGLQYQHISARTLEEESFKYLEDNLRILSGFYGILKPTDAISEYRLEMQAKINYKEFNNLYSFWGELLANSLKEEEKTSVCLKDTIINLASKEYSKAISKYAKKYELNIFDINFYELTAGKLKQKGTLAKMARGEFVRFMAIKKVNSLDMIKGFRELGFIYSNEYSNEKELNFILKKS